jgi:hypothetical protein
MLPEEGLNTYPEEQRSPKEGMDPKQRNKRRAELSSMTVVGYQEAP